MHPATDRQERWWSVKEQECYTAIIPAPISETEEGRQLPKTQHMEMMVRS